MLLIVYNTRSEHAQALPSNWIYYRALSWLARMEAVATVLLLFQAQKREMLRANTAHKRRKTRRRMFKRRKSMERFVFVCFLSLALLKVHSPLRTVWSKERSGYWWEKILKEAFSTHDWSENFRMSKQTFMCICNELRGCIEKKNTAMRDSIPTEQRVAITLWYLSTGTDFRTIGHLFGVAKSTVCIIVKDVCHAIVQLLLPKYIKWPVGDALVEVVQGFERKWGFPQCGGAIDGTHIPIISPEYCPADYFNHKGWHSVIMQGVVDHLGHFTDVYCGWPGRVCMMPVSLVTQASFKEDKMVHYCLL